MHLLPPSVVLPVDVMSRSSGMCTCISLGGQHRSHHVLNITYNSIVDKLLHNIIRCKAYGIPNAQNKTCEMLNGS